MTRFRISHPALMAVLAVAVGLPVAAAAPAAAATTYTITDLGSLGSGTAAGTAINASGQVTGYSVLPKLVQVPCLYPQKQKCFAQPIHAFLWSNGTMADLDTLGGLNSNGMAISDSGEVVGTADTKTGSSLFLWNGHNIRALSVMTKFGGAGINDSGQIAGQCNELPANPEVYGCVVSNGTPTALPDCLSGEAVAINNNGQVLGDCPNAVLFTNGAPTVLPTLGGGTSGGTAISSNGQVVGTAKTSTGAFDGFLWSNGTLTDLGPNFSPAAVNASGVVVGGQFIYSNGTLQNLNNLIPAGSPYQIESATGINDNGQIVANATDTATGQTHALLLSPH
jgi:probable HAF family extracellular repeat protein